MKFDQIALAYFIKFKGEKSQALSAHNSLVFPTC